MKAISLRHPTVDVILAGFETTLPRAAATRHRGPVLLHASARFGEQERAQLAALRRAGIRLEPPAPEACGAVVGRARLVGCRPLAGDDWTGPLAGLRGGRRWAYELADVQALSPVPCAGHLFMFEAPRPVVSAAAAAARRAGRAPRPRPARARGAR